MAKYLESSEIIDFYNEKFTELADTFSKMAKNKTNYVKIVYEYVRDSFSHSADANYNELLCTASEVLNSGHGICFSKSHLLAALLRCNGIPVGFCYQKLILDDETAPYLVLHGLNAVYLEEYDRWIRLDARGNRKDINSQFLIWNEQLAFQIREEKGEEDILTVFSKPDKNVVEVLKKYSTRSEFFPYIPRELSKQ